MLNEYFIFQVDILVNTWETSYKYVVFVPRLFKLVLQKENREHLCMMLYRRDMSVVESEIV